MTEVKVGDRVEFLAFGTPDTDEPALSAGDQGTVRMIDSLGTIHVAWDSGRRLGLLTKPWPGDKHFVPDSFRLLK